MLENKLGIMDSAELAREEERLSKTRAKELFEKDLLAGEPAVFYAAENSQDSFC